MKIFISETSPSEHGGTKEHVQGGKITRSGPSENALSHYILLASITKKAKQHEFQV